jgi:hypothetical protein
MDTAVKTMIASTGRIDVLVNNAGYGYATRLYRRGSGDNGPSARGRPTVGIGGAAGGAGHGTAGTDLGVGTRPALDIPSFGSSAYRVAYAAAASTYRSDRVTVPGPAANRDSADRQGSSLGFAECAEAARSHISCPSAWMLAWPSVRCAPGHGAQR